MSDKVLLGNTTFLSFGMVSSIVGVALYVADIKDQSDVNLENIKKSEVKIEELRKGTEKTNSQLSKIEGKLDILIQKAGK